MILNLTDFQFSTNEKEALSFGLKFVTGIHQNIITNTILCNYRNGDTDFSRGFIQGIILISVSQQMIHPFLKDRYGHFLT